MIRMLVGRCHVGESNKRVIRYVISRLKDKETTFWSLSNAQRKGLMQACIKEHAENRQLYNDVMRGV